MKYDHDELREMIPLYINGRLSADETAIFEKALENDPVLEQELAEFEEVAALYPDIEETVPFPSSERVFARIMDNIDVEEKQTPADDQISLIEKMTDFFRTTFFSPRVAWAVAGVQLVLLITLVGTLPDKEVYQTLSSGQSSTAVAQKLNVVFNEDAMEKDIRALLNKIDAGIVAGPLANGLYVIEVRTPDEPGKDVVQVLMGSNLVQLAEPNY